MAYNNTAKNMHPKKDTMCMSLGWHSHVKAWVYTNQRRQRVKSLNSPPDNPVC